jgi:hypothetical protein
VSIYLFGVASKKLGREELDNMNISMHIALYTGCHKKIFRILREGWMILSKTFF